MDGILDVNKPEALIYEPQSNGKLRIVGVEYIVPKEAWDALHPDPLDRPALLGHLLNFVERAEPLRHRGRLLRDPRLGVRGQPEGRAHRLESRRDLRETTPSRACERLNGCC